MAKSPLLTALTAAARRTAADAAEEEAERQRAGLREHKHAGGLHESQAKIKVVGLNEM